jgi:hypothetical protein
MTDLLPAAGLILTVLLAYMQIQKTHKKTIEAQEAHLRNELKVNLYEKAAPVFQEAAYAATAAASDYRTAVSVIEMQAKGLPFAHFRTADELLEVERRGSQSLTAVLVFLEQHEIAFTRFRAIRRELSEAHKEYIDSHSKLWLKLVTLIPPPPGEDGRPIRPLQAPTVELAALLRESYDDFASRCSDINSYLIDLQIAAQNELLGALFQRQLPPRRPGDPNLKVLERDDVEEDLRPPGRLI